MGGLGRLSLSTSMLVFLNILHSKPWMLKPQSIVKPPQTGLCFFCNFLKIPCVPRSYQPKTLWESSIASIPNPYHWRTDTAPRAWAPSSGPGGDGTLGTSDVDGTAQPRYLAISHIYPPPSLFCEGRRSF